jgi:hypothetical protein
MTTICLWSWCCTGYWCVLVLYGSGSGNGRDFRLRQLHCCFVYLTFFFQSSNWIAIIESSPTWSWTSNIALLSHRLPRQFQITPRQDSSRPQTIIRIQTPEAAPCVQGRTRHGFTTGSAHARTADQVDWYFKYRNSETDLFSPKFCTRWKFSLDFGDGDTSVHLQEPWASGFILW